MKLNDLKEKSLLVLGVGREGRSVLKFLKGQFPSKKIDVADQKQQSDLPENVGKTFFGENYLSSLSDYDVIVKSPGIPYFDEIKNAKSQGKIITSETAIFLENCNGQVIGVTGTKGKSTTASLIYEVLKNGGLNVFLTGNIGTPALDFLEQDSSNAIFVYELSSFQLEDLEVSPHIAVITNIYPEHLDHHGSFTDYQAAKFNITRYQKKNDYFIYNDTNPILQEFANESPAQTIPFISDRQQILKTTGLEEIQLLGEINLQNITAAIKVSQLLGVSRQNIGKAIVNFKPLPHRLEFVGEFRGIKFYNDSLSTIPEAAIGALNALGKNVETLIAGGFDRGLDYSVLGEAIAKSNIKNLILFPETGDKIWKTLELKKNENLQFDKNQIGRVKLKIKKFDTESMREAIELAFKHTTPGKTVLLSPASSSFNLFKNYEDRGNQFKEWVLNLGASN